MDDRRVADYFVVAGLPENPQPLEEFSNEAAIKSTYKQDPITDITVINKSLGDKVPNGYVCLEKTPSEYPADLNHGSILQHEMYICYRRSRDKPPLTDVGVLYESKERLMGGCEVILQTYYGSPANVNNSSNQHTYITYRRAPENAPSDMLAVVDLCVILENKGEGPPHSYCQIHKNLNRSMVGSSVYLCYKKAMTKTDILAYKPAVLDRYPREDYEDFPLPESVAMFCLPMGATVECWSAKSQHPLPVYSTFVLTGIGWNKVYGAAITFYEEYPEDKLSDFQMRNLGVKNKNIREQYRIRKTVHSNKSICLLSHWPFFDPFRKLLSYLHRVSITSSHIVPIERHISHFMYDVPYPSPQRPRILVQLNQDSICLSMPEDSPLPQTGASFLLMLKDLGPENCMTILLYVLHEHKILIHSLRPAVLTSVAEAVSTLIFPLQWQCPYIPLCPLGLSDLLQSPTPYIIGLDSRYFDLFDPPPDVICVDLDTINIWPPDDKKNISYKLLPKKPAKVLQESLHKLYDKLSTVKWSGHDESTVDMGPMDLDFKRKHREMVLDMQIQEAFLRFMACIMKGYKQYLKPIENAPDIDTTNAASLFDMQGFLKSRDKANHKFMQTLLRTQLFNRFIEERSFVSDKDDSLAFFDECCEKVVETSEEPRLIDLDDSQKSERTMFILPPEPVGLPEGVRYSYNGFPVLQPSLFLEKNKPARSASQARSQAGPNSPVARRTKQEVKTAQKAAQQAYTATSNPTMWAKCLLGHAYSLWYMTLPAYIKSGQSVTKALKLGHEVMRVMQKHQLKPPDELCFRVMLQLCGQYNKPELAVKVYSTMKRAGIQPNAITYGYYNKAVLEGIWPTAINQGRVLWRKLRNVVLGVAKFKRTVRRRSVSTFSSSESDQISRTSYDSFLEDDRVDARHEPIMKSEGHVEVPMFDVPRKTSNIPEEVERAASDRGYNSMTLEEAKTFSEIIDTEHRESKDKESKFRRDLKNVLSFSFRRKNKKSESEILEESKADLDDVSEKGSAAEKFQLPAHSIVRQSSIPGNTSSPDMYYGSEAGLLMVSEKMLSGSLPKSVVPTIGHVGINQGDEKLRKRHSSAGDHHYLKTRSNSLLPHWKIRHPSSEENRVKGNDLASLVSSGGKEMLSKTIDSNVGVMTSEMQELSEEIKDSGVGLDDNEVISEGNEEGAELEKGSDECDKISVKNVSSEDSGISDSALTGYATEQRLEGITEMKSRSDSLKSATSSPLHSIVTPVTENDPLGLFVEPVAVPKLDTKSSCSKQSSPVKDRKDFVLKKPFQDSSDLGGCNTCTFHTDGITVRVDQSEPSKLLTPVDSIKQTVFKIERTNSFPGNLGQPSVQRAENNGVKSEVSSLGRSITSLNEPKRDQLSGTLKTAGLFRNRSFRSHKDNISGMLKFATGAVANKLSEIKWLTPTKLGSNNSLTPSHDEDSEDEYNRGKARKKGSLDFLNRSNDQLDSSSINGVHESAPSGPSFMERMDRECEAECDSVLALQPDCEQQEVVVEAEMSSCCRCTRCHCLLYDEEIMAGWNADDSNLNTACVFCNQKIVPHLLIYIKDHRKRKEAKIAEEEKINDELLIDFHEKNPSHTSYGKDANLCPREDTNQHFMFPDDEGAVDDPWVRHPSAEPSRATQPPSDDTSPESPEHGPTLSQMGRMGHRRTTSECLTSATNYSCSMDSLENCGGDGRNIRSPLSISMGSDDAEGHTVLTPERRRAMFEGALSSMEPVSVPYLSPIVLRKSLESIIESEGNTVLSRDTFLDDHPIIYWNLLWYCKRIGVSNHLPGFLLTAKAYNPRLGADDSGVFGPDNVSVRAMWDNLRIHQEVGMPMHLAWRNCDSSTTVDALLTDSQPFNRQVMHQIISKIQCNDVLSPIKMVMNGRRRLRTRRKRFRSMYRDIMYLALEACGRDNIDIAAFDREYKMAFSRLAQNEVKRVQRDDKPRSPLVQACRAAFQELNM
ncbi:DENN domain-containing protein Crag-like [Dreissena polymorpha]|uniref:DENN domain-containing protein Crag-like n=1 Tax=Dreissena polymorpha TaxID=45954 RepID=UPI0022641895|nr:DENN domain-containing protein Crag-like [Dreissena polymorpha]